MKNKNWLSIVFIVYCFSLFVDSSLGCIEPQPVLHAYRYIDNTGLQEGSWVNYACYQNYYLISGDLQRECNGGVLTGQPPVCDEYKVLTPAFAAVAEPGSVNSNEHHLTDGDELTCESTTSASDPSWTIEFDGMKQVFSVELTVGMTITFVVNRIEVHVQNTTQNPSTFCDAIDLPLASVEFNCPSNLIGSHLVIKGSGIGLGGLSLCEVKAKGKDWLSVCGDAPFVYGAKVTGTKTVGGNVVVEYSCVEGFYYGGKNPESTCLNGQWTKADILCLPYDSLYNPELKGFATTYDVLFDDDQNTCAGADPTIDPTDYRRAALNLYTYKPVELLSLTVTIGVSETWDDIEFRSSPFGSHGYNPDETPPCEYDGLSTDSYRVRTFYCQPFAYSNVLDIIIRDLSSNLKQFCEIKSTVRTDLEALECIREEYVNEYKGKMNYTWDGKPCDNWADAPPDKAINTTIHKTFKPNSELNYCRNIGGEKKRPWCWVDNFQSVGYCPLAFCNEVCNLKEEYTEYKGKQPFTTSGKRCREWSDGNEEGRKFLAQVFSDGVQAGPYCRNPGYSQFRAWCYVDGPFSTIVPEPCDVPHCPTGFLQLTVRINETSTFPIYLHQCYEPLDSFNVQHFFNLTIDESTINSLCSYFQNKWLFCFMGGDWTRVEFDSFDLPSVTSTMVETSSIETSSIQTSSIETSSIQTSSIETSSIETSSIQTSSVDTSLIETLSIETSSIETASIETSSIQTSAIQTSSIETSSIETSSIETSSIETSSIDTSSIETSSSDYSTLQITQSLSPSFSLSSMDTAVAATASPGTTVSLECTKTITVTQPLNPCSSSFWYESSNNDSNSNKKCGCFCIRDYLLNFSNPVVKAKLLFLTQSLEMDYEKLSATIRKRISVEDDRPSVIYVGSTAVLILVICFAVILFNDALSLCRYVYAYSH